jgi:hypothetical protein
MKRSKKYWTFTAKQKGKKRTRATMSHLGFSGMPLWFQQYKTDLLDSQSGDFSNGYYIHPNRTGKGTAKWEWW